MTRTSGRILTLAMAAAFATACDPGWHYEAHDGAAIHSDGLRYDIRSASGILVRIYANAFTSKLIVEATLTNDTRQLVTLHSPRLEVTDAHSAALPADATSQTCPFIRGAWEIPPKGSCTAASQFAITPLVPGLVLPKNNPDLEHIRVKIATGAPQPFPDIEIAMTRMH